MIKTISIIVVTTLVSLVFWATADPWVHGNVKFADPSVWVAPLTLLIFLASTTSLAYLLIDKKRYKLLTTFLIGITYLLIFGFHYLNLLAFFFMLLFHLWAIRNIQLESKERLKIHIGLIIRRGISYIMLPIFMALSFSYFLSPSIDVRALEPDLAPNLKQIVQNVAEQFLEGDYEYIPVESRKQVGSYAIERAYDGLMSYFKPYQQYFPPILAFGLFLILWGLGFILNKLSMWLGILIFWILKKTRFLDVREADVKAQQIFL